MLKLLLLEDDPLIAASLVTGLRCEDFEVTLKSSLPDARRELEGVTFDVILLDFQLPEGNSLSFCQEARARFPSLPILMLTAQHSEEVAISALSHGADDFVRKPFGIRELVARINRLRQRSDQKDRSFVFRSLHIEPSSRQASVNSLPLKLTPKEFEILHLLIRRQGDTISREEILAEIDRGGDLFDRTIDSHLSHLRKKLRAAGAKDVLIAPVYGIGYRLEST